MIKSGFFNSVNGDRKYNASTIGEVNGFFVTDGVFPNPSTNLHVMAVNGMNIKLKAGRAWCRSHFIKNDADYSLTVSQSNMVYDRIDAVILYLDESEGFRDFVVRIKSGTPSASPLPPTMTVNENVKEMALAYVDVKANSTTITDANIKDMRPDNKVCGWVTGLIDQVDTSTLFLQWQAAYEEFFEVSTAEFNEWFKTIQETLKKTTLVQQVTSKVITNIQNQKVIPIGVEFNFALDILEVYVNGFRLVSGNEYSFNQTTVTLVEGLDIDQSVELVIFKSIERT